MITNEDKDRMSSYVKTKFDIELTDSQWQIVYDEVDGREPDELMSEVIDYVVTHLDEYEDDNLLIAEMNLAIQNGEVKQFLDKNFG